MTFDEVLEEIYALPIGETISDQAARTIIGWYCDEDIEAPTSVVYLMASSYEKLCLDHLADYYDYHYEEIFA